MTVPTVPDERGNQPLVDAAVSALRTFGASDRNGAAVLLSMWGRRGELSPGDRLAVLDRFGPAPAMPAHDGFAVGGRR